MATRRDELREALRSGDVNAADAAMNELLAPGSAATQTEDIALVLDAIDRLGTPALSRMGETFLLLAQDQLPVALPAIVDRIERAPLSAAGNLAATVICELLEWRADGIAQLDRERALRALIAAAEQVSQTPCDRAWSAVHALALWAAREPIPEAGPALAGVVSQAASVDSPNRPLVRDAFDALRRSGQDPLLAPVRTRIAQLPATHPVRELLG